MSVPLAKTQPGVDGRILRAAASVGVAAVAVKILAAVKEFAVAGVYGRSDAMDAFLAAWLIPNLLVNLIAESMNQALAPTLVRVREQEGKQPAQRLLAGAMLWSCGLLVLVSLLMALGARWLFPVIASNFGPEKLAMARQLFFALLPMVVLAGIATNCITVLNTRERFGMPALIPALSPAAILAGALLLGARHGIWALVWSTLSGGALYTLAALWLMEREGYRFRMWWYGASRATREVARQYGPVLLSSVVASGGLLVDQAMAAMLSPGSVSTLAYANRFVAVIVGLLGGAVSSAVMPYFSQMVARREWTLCRATLGTWLRRTLAVSVPAAVALVTGSSLLVRLAYQHGAFGARDTATVAPVLAMYALQIPFYVSSRVFYRFLLALGRTDLIFYCGVLNLGLDVVLNIVLMRWMGVAGIALATSLWTVATFAFLGFWATRLLRQAEEAAR